MTVQIFRGAGGADWRYEDLQVLGDGGFGVVYLGWGSDGAEVAVKVLDLNHPLAPPLDQLRREVEIAERINAADHPHLLPAIDHAVTNTSLFLVIPRAKESLHDALGKGMDPAAQLEAMKQMAAGLQALHGVPILHRDLKPKNVLLGEDGWMLADFGISRDLDESTATLTWARAGTLAYMAPELFVPPYAATVKSDLYALGCIFYELCAGRRPFEAGDPMKLAEMHRRTPPPALPESVNVTVNRLVLRLLEKTPDSRPQDARAVVEALHRVVMGPVSPEGARLQALARGHADERARESAAAEAARAATEAHEGRVRQAMTDLRYIVQTGGDLISAALPDVQYRETRRGAQLKGDEATLHFEVWDEGPEAYSGNPAMWGNVARLGRSVGGTPPGVHRTDHLLYGEVQGENRRRMDEPPLGNLVCEVREGRLVWTLYRYRDAVGRATRQMARAHGFSSSTYFSEQVYPYAFRDWGGMHVFRRDVDTALTPEVVQSLYGSALALPGDSR